MKIRNLRRLAALAILTIAAGAGLPTLAGCAGPVTKEVTVTEGPSISPTTLPLIRVENPNGAVRIQVDPTLRHPVVKADVTSDTRLTPSERARLNERLRLSARTSVDGNQTRLDVNLGPRARTDEHPVSIVVRTPSCGSVVIRNAGGPVELIGVGGEVNIVSGGDDQPGGHIRIRTEMPMHGPVRIETTDGDVVVFAPSRSSGDVELSTDNGRARLFARGASVTRMSADARRWTGRVNDGANEISIHTRRGNVRVTLVDYPYNRDSVFDWSMEPGR